MDRPRILKGFTVIELLIVIFIMILILGTGYANFRGFQRRQHLEGAVRIVKGDLRSAQEYALAARKEVACTSGIDGYYFTRVSATSYEIRADCIVVADQLVKTVDLLALYPGVQISAISYPTDGKPIPANTIRFNLLGRGTSIVSGSSTTITMSYPGSGVSNITIVVTSAGEFN